MPKISVLMAVCNAEKTLPKAIKSILEQRFQDFEFIIVDDASTDNSPGIIKKFAERDKRIKVLSNKANLGLTRSLNIGLKKCKGKYIARQDADDVSHRDRLRLQYQFLKENDQVTAVGSAVTIPGVKKLKYSIKHNPSRRDFVRRNPLIHSTLMIRGTLLKEIGYDDHFTYAQDYKLWIDLLSRGCQIRNLPQPLVEFNLRGQTISHSKKYQQRYFAYRARLAGFKNNLFPKIYLPLLIRPLLSLLFHRVFSRQRPAGGNTCIILPSLKGGAANYVLNFLQNSDREYYLIAKNDNPELAKRLAKLTVAQLYYKNFWCTLRALKWLKKNGMSLLFAQGMRSIYQARILKLFNTDYQICSIYHGYHFVHYRNPLKRMFFLLLENTTSGIDDAKIFLTRSDRKAYGKTKNSSQIVIPNEIIFPAKINNKRNHDKKSLVVGYIGRFAYQKGFDLLLTVIKKLSAKNSSIKFILKGSGDYQNKQLQGLKKSGQVKVLPYSDQVESFYRSVDLVVFPSRWEGLPLSVLEAAGYGVPVIVSNVCGNKDLINSNSGVLIEKPIVPNLVEILANVKLDTLRKKALNARKKLIKSHGTPKRMVARTENFIDKVKS